MDIVDYGDLWIMDTVDYVYSGLHHIAGIPHGIWI